MARQISRIQISRIQIVAALAIVPFLALAGCRSLTTSGRSSSLDSDTALDGNLSSPIHAGSWADNHKPLPVPTGRAALGSPGDAKASFVDVAGSSGLSYRWHIAGPRPLDILQTIGNGCAFLDYDNDGNLDILLVGTDHLALFRGDGRGHFRDVSQATGLATLKGHFLGCAVGDYDNDGYEDLYISGYRTGLLLHNEGGRRFRDVTQAAGLRPQPWGTSAAFGDVDNDGRLDIYVGNYVDFDPAKNQRLCTVRGHTTGCGPYKYKRIPGVLYHNDGHGRFSDVTQAYVQHVHGATLGVAFADYDGSGRPSLYLSNDEVEGDMLQNVGKKLLSAGLKSGTAYGGPSVTHGGMGMDWGDYTNEGRLSFIVATYRNETKCIYHNEGGGLFREASDSLALTAPTRPYVAFGTKWLDYDNDGWLDLMIANGHVQDNVAAVTQGVAYREPTQLFHNDHGRVFVDLSAHAGEDLQKPVVGRGLAVGEFDNDGRVDALVVDSEGAPLLLRNESAPVGHWLLLKLIGVKSNRDGIGALVTVTAGGLTQTRLCHTDGSYLSASDVRVHVGLGKAMTAQTVSIRWPSGRKDVFHNVRADRIVVAREGVTSSL